MAPRVADAKRKDGKLARERRAELDGSENATPSPKAAPPSRPAGFGPIYAEFSQICLSFPKDRSSHQIFNTSHGRKTLETAAERRPSQKSPDHHRPLVCATTCQTRTVVSCGGHITAERYKRVGLFSRARRLPQLRLSKMAKLGKKTSLILRPVLDKEAWKKKHNPVVKARLKQLRL